MVFDQSFDGLIISVRATLKGFDPAIDVARKAAFDCTCSAAMCEHQRRFNLLVQSRRDYQAILDRLVTFPREAVRNDRFP